MQNIHTEVFYWKHLVLVIKLCHIVIVPHKNFNLIYYFNDFRAISVCWHVAEIFLVLMWGPHFCEGPCSAEHAEHA